MSSERRLDVGAGFVRAKECPDCGHTRCGESCVCNCDAAHAEHEAAALRTALNAARATVAAMREERDRARVLAASVLNVVPWKWQSDGGNDLPTMSEDMVLTMTAGTLRNLIAAAVAERDALIVELRAKAEAFDRILAIESDDEDDLVRETGAIVIGYLKAQRALADAGSASNSTPDVRPSDGDDGAPAAESAVPVAGGDRPDAGRVGAAHPRAGDGGEGDARAVVEANAFADAWCERIAAGCAVQTTCVGGCGMPAIAGLVSLADEDVRDSLAQSVAGYVESLHAQLIAKVTTLEGELAAADKHILEHDSSLDGSETCWPDYACAQCRPHSAVLVEGFVCAWHRAKERADMASAFERLNADAEGEVQGG